jgi:hypothetical protein
MLDGSLPTLGEGLLSELEQARRVEPRKMPATRRAAAESAWNG